MIRDSDRDFVAYTVLVERAHDGSQFYALAGNYLSIALFAKRKDAKQFRDELALHILNKCRVVKVRVRIDPA